MIEEGKTVSDHQVHKVMTLDKITQMKKEGRPTMALEKKLAGHIAALKAAKRGAMREESELEELDELSKETLQSYKKKAAFDVRSANSRLNSFDKETKSFNPAKDEATLKKRYKGWALAGKKEREMAEEVELTEDPIIDKNGEYQTINTQHKVNSEKKRMREIVAAMRKINPNHPLLKQYKDVKEEVELDEGVDDFVSKAPPKGTRVRAHFSSTHKVNGTVQGMDTELPTATKILGDDGKTYAIHHKFLTGLKEEDELDEGTLNGYSPDQVKIHGVTKERAYSPMGGDGHTGRYAHIETPDGHHYIAYHTKDANGKWGNFNPSKTRNVHGGKKHVSAIWRGRFAHMLDEGKVVVSTKKPIGVRIADIGTGGKESNVKTDKAWNNKEKFERAQDRYAKGLKARAHPERIKTLKYLRDLAKTSMNEDTEHINEGAHIHCPECGEDHGKASEYGSSTLRYCSNCGYTKKDVASKPVQSIGRNISPTRRSFAGHQFANSIGGDSSNYRESVEMDESIGSSLKKLVRNKLLGNTRSVIQTAKHKDLAQSHHELGNTAAAGRHERAANRTEKAWTKAQMEETELDEASTTITKDKKGNITKWKEEGDWHKADVKKNAGGKAANLAGQALKSTKVGQSVNFDNDETSHQAKTTLKHIKNPSYADRADANMIKPGVAGYRDRAAMIKRAEDEGKIKEEVELDETVYDPITKKNVPRKAIKQQAGGTLTRNGVPFTPNENKKSLVKSTKDWAADSKAYAEKKQERDAMVKRIEANKAAGKKPYSWEDAFKKEEAELDENIISAAAGTAGKMFAKIAPKSAKKMVDSATAKEKTKKDAYNADTNYMLALAKAKMDAVRKEGVELDEAKVPASEETVRRIVREDFYSSKKFENDSKHIDDFVTGSRRNFANESTITSYNKSLLNSIKNMVIPEAPEVFEEDTSYITANSITKLPDWNEMSLREGWVDNLDKIQVHLHGKSGAGVTVHVGGKKSTQHFLDIASARKYGKDLHNANGKIAVYEDQTQ